MYIIYFLIILEVDSATNPSNGSYVGPNAFSEPESQGMSKFIAENGAKMVAYIAFHSYHQSFNIPYADSDDRLDNYDELVRIICMVLHMFKYINMCF